MVILSAGRFFVSLAIALFTTPSFAQTSDDPLDEAKPAPASVGADIPLTYFGPPPSEVQRELIGPYKLLKAGQVDEDAGTVTLPLYQGRMKDGRQVWFVLTDTDDKLNAEQLGLNCLLN